MKSLDTSISKCFFLAAPVLRVVGLALFEILHTRNLRYPVPTDEIELVVVVHALPQAYDLCSYQEEISQHLPG